MSNDTFDLKIKISPNDRGNPPGKLADAELHFVGGPLDGLKLIGFAIWERRMGNGRNVTFPARQYTVNWSGKIRNWTPIDVVVLNPPMNEDLDTHRRNPVLPMS